MLRSLFFVGLAGFTMMLASCASSRVTNLTKTTQETLELVKKEAQRAIALNLHHRIRCCEEVSL